jgi:hypothetical protein
LCVSPPHAPLPPSLEPAREYLQQLLDYLVSFYERTQPLAQLRRQLEKLEEELQGQFAAGGAPGWEDKGVGGAGGTAEELGIDLEGFDSVEEVEMMGEGGSGALLGGPAGWRLPPSGPRDG